MPALPAGETAPLLAGSAGFQPTESKSRQDGRAHSRQTLFSPSAQERPGLLLPAGVSPFRSRTRALRP